MLLLFSFPSFMCYRIIEIANCLKVALMLPLWCWIGSEWWMNSQGCYVFSSHIIPMELSSAGRDGNRRLWDVGN